MRIIVAHNSPDLDAIASVWLIKKFLQGWEEAEVRFVPAGERIRELKPQTSNLKSAIEEINGDEVIHVDTGFGPLDHHDTDDTSISAASLTWEFIKKAESSRFEAESSERVQDKMGAIERMVEVVVDVDHFKEIFWDNPLASYHEFSVLGILDGLKIQKPNQDDFYIDFIMQCLDAVLHNFENRIWAEREIKEKGVEFETRFGKGLGLETINDSVVKLAQKMGYSIVVRKDPRKGYVRVKARPSKRLGSSKLASNSEEKKLNAEIDLTLVYEKMKKMDPSATWFLHISKKMLLNGSVKNPKMRATRLSLNDIIEVLRAI